MPRINNKAAYPIDHQLSLDDFLLGSNADNIDKTQNYLLRGIFSTFKNSLNLSSLEYEFAGGANPELDETVAGYFTTNSNETVSGAVTSIFINKLDLNGVDISSLITTVAQNVSSFVINLSKPSASGQIFYFAIDAIVDSGDYFTITVTNFVGGNTLVDETTYSLSLDLAGIPSDLTEEDPIFVASPAYGITSSNISNWNTAFGWGDHSSAGYQAGLNGTGIVKSTSGTISYVTDNSANWNTAFGWGDHSAVGYITTETDPVFVASDAYDITSTNKSNWNTAFGWGNHATQGYLTSFSETDPVFTASQAFSITSTNKSEWSQAYAWGDHAVVGYELQSNKATDYSTVNDTLYPTLQATENRYSQLGHTHTFSSLTSKPTTIAGYGITDAYSKTEADGKYLLNTTDTLTGDLSVTNQVNAERYYSVTASNNWGFRGVSNSLNYSGIWFQPDHTPQLLIRDAAGSVVTKLSGNGSNSDNIINGNTIWHAGNDGSGSGLDADLWRGFGRPDNFGQSEVSYDAVNLDNIEVVGQSVFYRPTSSGTTNSPDSGGGYMLQIAQGDVAGARGAQLAITRDTNSMFFRSDDRSWLKVWHQGNDGSGSGLDADLLDGINSGSFLRSDAEDTKTSGNLNFLDNILAQFGSGNDFRIYHNGSNNYLGLKNGDLHIRDTSLSTDRFIFGRSTGNLTITGSLIRSGGTQYGGLVGNYNQNGSDAAGSYPIYSLGTSFIPNGSTLGNHYGIGYSGGAAASFLNSTDLGTTPGGWGMYVSADGNARLYFEASNGISRQLGASYASNFILNSDRRRKSKIEDIKVEEMSVRWRTFELDTEPDIFRVGVIAQELQDTHPEFVESDIDGNLTVKYIDLLAAKMAEKDRQIEEQEERIQVLEDKIDLLIKTLL